MAYERRTYKGNVAYTITLASSLVGGDTAIPVSDGSTLPDGSAGPFTITLDPGGSGEEKVKIATRTGNTLTVATLGRGYDGTPAGSHASGVKVFHTISAVDLDEANQAVVQTIGKVTTAGDLLVASGADAFKRLGLGTGLQVLRTNAGATDLEYGPPSLASSAGALGSPYAVTTGFGTFLTTASLAVGTWLVTLNGLAGGNNANVELEILAAAGTATASLAGAFATQMDVAATDFAGPFGLSFIATVTVAGTLVFQAKAALVSDWTIAAATSTSGLPDATGYTAIRIA